MCYGSFSDSELVRPHLCHFLIAHLIRQQMSAFYPFKGGYQRFFTGHFWPTNVHCRFLLYYKRTFFHIFWEEITNFCMVKARDWVRQIGPCALLFSKLQFKDLIDRQQFVVEACQRGGGWQICSDATSPQLAHTLLLFKNTLWKSTLLKNTLWKSTLWKNTLFKNTLKKIHTPPPRNWHTHCRCCTVLNL